VPYPKKVKVRRVQLFNTVMILMKRKCGISSMEVD
jgi:hypothetical protein